MISKKKGGFRRFGVQFLPQIFSVCGVYHEENDTRGKPVINVPPAPPKNITAGFETRKSTSMGKYKYRYNEEGGVGK